MVAKEGGYLSCQRQTEQKRFNALVEKGSTDRLEEAELNWLLSYYATWPMLRYLAGIGLIKKMQGVDKATLEPIFSKVDESTFVKKKSSSWSACSIVKVSTQNALSITVRCTS